MILLKHRRIILCDIDPLYFNESLSAVMKAFAGKVFNIELNLDGRAKVLPAAQRYVTGRYWIKDSKNKIRNEVSAGYHLPKRTAAIISISC